MTAVPQDLVDLVEGGVSSFIGTVDENGRPDAALGCGASLSRDRTKITVFVPVVCGKRAMENLEKRPTLAAGFSRIGDHVSLQIKGRCVERRMATDRERSVSERYLGAYVEQLAMVGLPRHLTRRLAVWPAYAFVVEITDLFVQTPGPGAGERLEPRP